MWVTTRWTKIRNGDWGNGLFAVRDIPKGTFITDLPLEEKGRPFDTPDEAGHQNGLPFYVYSANSKTHLRLTRADQWIISGNKWQMGLFANHAPSNSPLSNGIIVAHHYRAGSWKVRIKTTKPIRQGTEVRVPYNNHRWSRTWKPGSQSCSLIFPLPALPKRPSFQEVPRGSPIVSLTIFKRNGETCLSTFNNQYFLPMLSLLQTLSASPMIRETGTRVIIFYDDSIDDLPSQVQTLISLPRQPTFVKIRFGHPWRRGGCRLGHKGYLMTLARFCVASWPDISLALIRDINYAWTTTEEQAFQSALAARTTGHPQHIIWRPSNYTEQRPNLSACTFISLPDERLNFLLMNALKLEIFGGLCTLGAHLLQPEGPPSMRETYVSHPAHLALAQTAHSLLKKEGKRLLDESHVGDTFRPNLKRLANPPKNFTLNWLFNNIRPSQNAPSILPGGHWGCDEYLMSLWTTWNRADPEIPVTELTHVFDHSLDSRSLPPSVPSAPRQPSRPLSSAELNSLKAAHTRNEKKRKRLEKLEKARTAKTRQ